MRPIPFKGAIFDLDGTLLDSMYVWKRVDERFFGRRGLPLPEHYGLEIAGMSYRETAEYTVAHYTPDECWEDLIREWTELAVDEYAHHVRLKPGALEYLRALKRAGIRLAVATAMTPELYEPCLSNLSIRELFDAVCSTEHTGGRGKAGGEVYLYAAAQLGLPPEDCAVFEDVVAGIRGARAAGMRAYCVREEQSRRDFPILEAESDRMLDSLTDMSAVHDLPGRTRCVIFTAYMRGNARDFYAPEPGDLVLCADGGWKHAQAAGITPDLVIGDFDSSEAPATGRIERHPRLKDDTDTMLCLREGLRRGYDRFLVLGGLGGRVDHTLANLQCLDNAARMGAELCLQDAYARVWAVHAGSITVPRSAGKLSVLALSDHCTGVSIHGALYEPEDIELTNRYPLGISNEFTADEAVIGVKTGTLLVIVTDD